MPNIQNLIQGNCLEVMCDIPDNSIDMICCDPPFETTKCKWDTNLDLPKLWDEYRRITTKNAAIVLFAQTPFDKVIGCSNLPWLRYELIWEKTHATGFLNAKRMPMKAHENILVFYNKLPTYNQQKTSGHVRKTAVKRHDVTPIYMVIKISLNCHMIQLNVIHEVCCFFQVINNEVINNVVLCIQPRNH